MKMRRERNIQSRKRQDFRREDSNNKRITKIRNIELRAISIGPKPFFFFVWCVFYVEIESCFLLKKGILFIFECLPPFFLPFVLPTLSHFPFSLSLSLSLFSLLFSCFLPFLFAFFFPSLFFCCFVLPCLFAFVSCKEEHQDISSRRFFSSVCILFCCFPVFVESLKSPFVFFVFFHGPSPC